MIALLAVGCRETISESPSASPPESTFEEGQALFAEGRFDEAAEALRPYALDPIPDPEAALAYVRALVGAQRFSVAIWPLQRLAQREDASPEVKQLYVSTLLYGGADRESVAEATRLLEENPDDHALRGLRAYGYQLILDEESAMEDLEILVDELPNNPRVREQLLNLYLKQEMWDEARNQIAQLRSVLESTGARADVQGTFCATAARFEMERGNVALAEAELDDCLERFPSHPDIVYSKLQLLDETDRVEEGTAFLEEVSQRAPGRLRIQEGYAGRLAQLGRVGDAAAVLESAAERIGKPQPWLSLGDLWITNGNFEKASDAIDRAIEAAVGKSPGEADVDYSGMSPEGLFGIGDVYIRARRFDRAEAIIATLEADEPALASLLRARLKLDRGDPQGALDEYQDAFRSYPSNPGSRYLAGRAAMEVGEFELGTSLYQDSLRADPKATDAGLVLAQMQMAEGNHNAAIDTLSFYLTGNPDDPHALRLIARAAATVGLHASAEASRAKLAEQLEWAGLAIAEQARDVAFLRGPAAARSFLEASPALELPTHFEAFSAWLAYARELGELDAARARAERLKRENADSPGPWIVWARLLYDEGDVQGAFAAIEKAIELNPLAQAAHAERGALLLEMGRIDDALVAFDRARELEPQDARPALSAALGLVEAGRLEEARARFAAILIPHPWHGGAALELVRLAPDLETLEDRDYHLARRAARYSAISGPAAFAMLGRVELARSQPSEAQAQFEAAIRASFEVPTQRYWLARAWLAQGRRDEAVRELEQALESPGFPEAAAAAALLEEIALEGGAR